MSNPLVNILICNYNYGKYIEQALKSALNQTYDNFEITIIDDASTDNSLQVLMNFIARNKIEFIGTGREANFGWTNYKVPDSSCKKLTVITCDNNAGPSTARNIGIEHTIGYTDVYAILDADDEMYSNKVEICVKHLMIANQVGVVYGDYDILNTDTNNLIREYKEPYSATRLKQECIVHSGSVITKAALLAAKDEFGFYDPNLRTCEDYDLWLRIAEKYMIFHIPQALTLVKVQPQNSSLTVNKNKWEDNYRRVLQKAHLRNNV